MGSNLPNEVREKMLLYSDTVGQTTLWMFALLWMFQMFLKTVIGSSLQLINVIDSCAILAGDFDTDPFLRGKTRVDPTLGRKVVARLEEFCR